MRYSRLVLLSTLSAFALLTASTTSRAFGPSATDIGLLKPHGLWQVGAINAQNVSYCAMVNQFDKEVSLAFARNSKGSGSLAISFPGEILETGAAYEIALQMDDQEGRRYTVHASSPRSIIVQIGQDDDFYSSLGSNGTLHIALPTIDMKFDLKKFSSSYISLVDCADKLPQRDGPRTAAMPVPSVDKLPLPTTVPETKTAALAPVTLTAPAQKNKADLQKQMDAVRQSLHDKGITTAEAKASPAATTATAAATPAAFPVSLTEKKDPLEENMGLKSKLSQAEMQQTELTNNVNLLKSEKDALQAKLDLKDKQSKLLEAALSAKDRDLSSVRSISNNDGKTVADTQAEIASLKRDRDNVVAELQSKLAEKSAQYDSLEKQFTDGGQVRRSAEERNAQAQTELETTRQRLTMAQTQLASMDQQKSDLATQLEFQGQQNKTLLQRVQEQLSKANQQLSLLESQLMSVGMQRDDLASQLDSEVNKNKALQASLEVKERELAYQSGPRTVPGNGRSNTNLSSSEKSYLPAITSPQTIGQDYASSAPVLKASAAGMRSATGSTDDNWETVVVQ